MRRRGGTRARIYPQPPFGDPNARLETVTLSPPAGTVGPGPADDRMDAVTPIGKDGDPYGLKDAAAEPWLYLPPWRGPTGPMAMPGPDGHFDHIPADDPSFPAAHMYACARYTLDVWEGYIGGPFRWHFHRHFDRLELSHIWNWRNAQMGYGYLETGDRENADGFVVPHALNFDIIAHEIGHALLIAHTGLVDPEDVSAEFEAFHEMSSDWVGLMTSLHLDSVVDDLLARTRGNLDTFNRLTRFGEISKSEQIRLANNNLTMADFRDGWSNEHRLALPLMGAFFDIFVDLYHEILVEMGAAPRALEAVADAAEHDPGLLPHVQAGFDRAFERRPELFREALVEARDIAARVTVAVWRNLDARRFDYAGVRAIVEPIAAGWFGGRLADAVRQNFDYRLIGLVRPGPRIERRGEQSHLRSARNLAPADD